MKKKLLLFFLLSSSILFSQQTNNRISKLKHTLDSLQTKIPGLTKKVDFSVNNIELPVFVRSVANTHKVNVSIGPELNNFSLSHNFSDATVSNIFLYLCKEYSLTIEPLGNILSIKKHSRKPIFKTKNIPVEYDSTIDKFSIELNNDTLSVAFKKITDVTGKNLVYSVGLGNKRISGYIQGKTFESAIDKLAFSNNLLVTKTKDDYYLFEEVSNGSSTANIKSKQRPRRYRSSNFFYQVNDTINKIISVDFENTDIASIIKNIGYDLNVGIFTNTSLTAIGKASIKTDSITYDRLLYKLLEDTPYTYKKEDNLYFLGKREQASLRSIVTVPLLHRSIEIMAAPMNNRNQFSYNTSSFNQNTSNNNYAQNYNKNGFNNQQQTINTRNNNRSFNTYNNKAEALINILPKEVTNDLEVKTDIERNSFIISGDAQKIEKFKSFIKEIDKPVPVILIEVMILEVNKSATVDTGIELGLGKKPVKDAGQLFPSADLTLGATTINKIIGGFNGFGSLNVGKVVPNFYAKINAMEANGNIKIRSTPKLSTLNGHKAVLSNGERSYYAITRRDIIGSQNPQTTEIKNYVPIDADLSIAIKPLVAGDNQITMSINVVQSSFNGKRIDKEAPPGMNSREFTSIIRVKDQDVVILGGLEENLKNDSGSGVPLLSRIPVIKWLFSKRKRIDSKKKLSVLIKPTIIK
ncbi:type II secretion system protein GspD [Tenacibaculum larymnensis]|uniref:General secretion pathway protein GspD n=1 Tax=Tenacibaculum larymnensis TaxID=2878201 RepID=A0A9X4ESS0_9FLAO|nr:general secretion pathway protein GspD [Tenacibaculum larymnensis]MDE1208070.1 general secretion pathway protein GspD [Tenacibaculum larymnensis]